MHTQTHASLVPGANRLAAKGFQIPKFQERRASALFSVFHQTDVLPQSYFASPRLQVKRRPPPQRPPATKPNRITPTIKYPRSTK